jgi:hypothetical protein
VLIELLEGLVDPPQVSRPSRAWQVWHANGPQATERVLASVLPTLLKHGEPCYLETAFPMSVDELGAGNWIPAGPNQWRVPFDLVAADFLQSQIHSEGSYAIYQRRDALEQGLPPELPWWGPATSRQGRQPVAMEALVTGLTASGVLVALVVHPDATDLAIAVPTSESSKGTA